jgi:aspartate aminotransferase-like enzyme
MNTHPNDIIHLLPGPVELEEQVIDEFHCRPVSHRSDEFMLDFQYLKAKLNHLVNSKYVEVLSGSGTLANETVAAQLSQNSEQGLILTNGEFGERLLSQANRYNLKFFTWSVSWGEPFSYQELDEFVGKNRQIKWIWAVHSETSTGVLNDLDTLKGICQSRTIKLCLDCISSIGIIPVNLENVYLASCSSGKALCSFPGLSMVFYNHEITTSPDIPKYLDLGYYRSADGIPYTISSNLVYALTRAVESFYKQENIYSSIEKNSAMIRAGLIQSKIRIVNAARTSSPAIVTIELPYQINSVEFGNDLKKRNCLISYQSCYLVKRNWIQTFITRNTTKAKIIRFLEIVNSKLEAPVNHPFTT